MTKLLYDAVDFAAYDDNQTICGGYYNGLPFLCVVWVGIDATATPPLIILTPRSLLRFVFKC